MVETEIGPLLEEYWFDAPDESNQTIPAPRRRMVTEAVPSPNAAAGAAGRGYVGRIPVRNLWLLMLYASDLFRMRGRDDLAYEDNPDELPDLVAEILAHAVEERQRRQLSLGYQRRNAVVARVRGRIGRSRDGAPAASSLAAEWRAVLTS